MRKISFARAPVAALAAMVALAGAVPAAAESAPRTRLVGCEAGSCLLVTGRRENAASMVRINGRPVAVEGARKWRARIPVRTLREWTAPFARTIAVSVGEVGANATAEAELPIGLLGHAPELALLVVTVK